MENFSGRSLETFYFFDRCNGGGFSHDVQERVNQRRAMEVRFRIDRDRNALHLSSIENRWSRFMKLLKTMFHVCSLLGPTFHRHTQIFWFHLTQNIENLSRRPKIGEPRADRSVLILSSCPIKLTFILLPLPRELDISSIPYIYLCQRLLSYPKGLSDALMSVNCHGLYTSHFRIRH